MFFSRWLLYRSNRVYWIINLFLTDLKCHLNHMLNSRMYFGFFLDFSVLPMDLFIDTWSHIVLMIIFGHLFLYLIGLVLSIILLFSKVLWLLLVFKFSILKVVGLNIMNLTSVLRTFCISKFRHLAMESEG